MNEKNILISVKLDENKIASRLKEIKTAMNNLEKDNQKLQNAIDKLGNSSGNFSRAIETNNNKIKSLQGEYTKLESKLSENNKATQNLADKTTNLSKAEEKLSSSVKDSNSSLNANEKELNKVGDALNKNESSTNQLASSQEKLGNSFTNNASKIQQLDGELNQSNKKLEEFKDKVNQLESKTINVDVNVNTNISGASNISTSTSDMISSIQNAGTDVSNLEMKLRQTTQAAGVLKQAFISLGAEGAASISQLVESVAGLAASIASENYVAAIGQAINVIGEFGDAVDEIYMKIWRLSGTFDGEFASLNEGFEAAETNFKYLNESVSKSGNAFNRFFSKAAGLLEKFGRGFGKTIRGMAKEHKGFIKAWKDGWAEADKEYRRFVYVSSDARAATKKQVDEYLRLSLEARDKIQQREEEIRNKELELEKASGEEKIRIENEIQNLKLKNVEEVWRIQEEKLKVFEDALKRQQAKGVGNKQVEDATTVDTSKLTEAEFEQLIKLRDAASQARAEYKSLDEQVNKLNSTFEKQVEILHDQEKLTEDRRKYESDEIDRVQKITVLRNSLGNKEKQILNIQKESLQERAKLIQQEIDLEEKKMSVVGQASEQQTERLHQLQMELKKTNYAIENLNSGFADTGAQVGGLGGLLGNFTNQVGESSQALSLLGFTGASSIKRISTGIKALSKVMTSWVGLVIAAVIIAIRGITKAFQENQALLRSLSNLYDAFKPILESINVLFEFLANVIAKVCDGLAKLIRLAAGTQEEFLKEQQRIVELNKAVDNLANAKNKYAKDEEARSVKIAELTKIVNDAELKSVDERLAAQEELNNLKEKSLKEAEAIANEELRIFKEQNQERINELEKTKRQNGELTEEQKAELDELTEKLHNLELASTKASNAIVLAESDARDSIIGIITDLTTEQIRERLKKLQAEKDAHDLEMQMIQEKLDAENAQIDILMKKVFAKNNLEEAVIFLRERGIEVLKSEENEWSALYGKLLAIRKVGALELGIDLKGQEMQKQIDMYNEALQRSIKRNTKTTTTKTKPQESEEEKQRKKEAEELAKYWATVLDESEKGLSAFLGEIREADKEFRELSMNPIEIFDMNLDESLKTLDARKAEIQAKIFEIQNTATNTDEEREQQQQALARYTEMYTEFESLRTAITQKAAKERAKLEEEMTKESLEHRLTEIERYYKRQKEEMMANPLDFSGGNTFTFIKNSEIDEAKMNLAQAKDEVNALKEALLELEPGTEAYEEMADRIVDANIKVIEKNKELIDSVANTAATYMSAMDEITGSISSLMAAKKKEVQNSKKSEAEKEALIHEYEEKEKQMTVAQIAFSTATAIAKGIADAMTLMYPANLAAMASTIAAIIAGIAQAKSAMAGYNDGGVIPGNSYTGDKLMIRANSDEMVLTKKQQTELFNIANGRGGSGNQFYMVKAFEKALSRMPSPTLEYSEFSTFTKSVSSMNNLVKIK